MISELLNDAVDSIQHGRPLVWCRLVETRGSTPQKAGAAMLVFEDGSQRGTLGGGCVEAEVKRRSLAALQANVAEIARFQLDSDYGWDDGLICGGRMHVLILPVRDAATGDYFRRHLQLVRAGQGSTEVVRFEDKSGSPLPAQWLIDEQQCVAAALPGREPLPSTVLESLKPLVERPRPYHAAGYSFLPNLNRCRLIIVGGGHVGQAVGNLAAELDFDVWVVDDREEYVTADRFPRAQRRIAGSFAARLPELEITPDTYCLIVTRGHNHDEEALFHLIDRGARYVGMIGSRRKIKLIMEDLANEGIADDKIAAVFAPVGIDIGSQTVPEIAVSICAEMVAHRNCGGVIPGKCSASSTT